VAPAGFEPLAPDVDGDTRSFEGDGAVIGRDLADVAAFSSESQGYAHIVVSRSDAAELARFADDDERWAHMVAARYVDRGDDRWARWWRDDEGTRTLRGHTYIGGCERTHIDYLVVERGPTLELWTTYTARGDVDGVYGALPSRAREVAEQRAPAYPGDPSIGRAR
jgi:hypothetical protein